MDIDDLERKLGIDGLSADEQMLLVDALQKSAQSKLEIANQEAIGKSTEVVIQGLKKIKSDLETRFSQLNATIQSKASSLRDGKDGKDGKNGKDGLEGKQGLQGINGQNGRDGRDGVDGIDGVSVTSARIDFDGSLVISLSSGVELNVGEVVAPDLAESIKVITNGGGTSQSVLDTLTFLQTQIDNLIPSQTGNSGKFLTTNGTTTSWATVGGGSGGLSYQGTWNASTNTPTLASSTGTNGYYYIVATAGSTNLNGITDWQVGDWLLFNGSVWQKIDQSEVLQSITSTDGSVTVTTTGSTADLSVAVAASTTNVICQVRNTTGATLTKGTVVYISGATGQNPTVTKAQANNDTNSAQTLGLMTADLANNSNGYVTIIGLITNIDTSAYTDGEQLYLSPTTAGALTATKPYAPQHLVYVAIVEHAHPTQGKLFVKVQNGYEMDELHNVSAQSPSNGQTLVYNATTSLWEKANLTAGTAISVSNGAGSITINNTGVTSAVAGTGISVSGATGAVTITNSAPDQTVALTGAGTTSITGTYPNFTITSNDAYTGTVTSVTGTSPVVSSGGATPAISLATAYGDTLNPYASKTANYVLAAPNGSAGVPTFRAIQAADIPTLNQNTTGTAANITDTSNSTLTTLSVLSLPYSQLSGTVPTWNQNTTGSAATLTTPRAIYGNNFNGSADLTGVIASTYGGTGNGFAKFTGPLTAEKTFTLPNASATILTDNAAVTVLQGGTGATTASGARTNLGLVIGTDVLAPNGSAASLTGFPTFNQNTTGTASNVTGTVAVANGGTGLTSTPVNGALDIGNGTGFTRTTLTGTASQVDVTNASGSITLSLPSTINVNTSGSAASLSSTLAIASGGTGQTTANSAFNALAPSQTSNSGKYLTTDGTNASWATLGGGTGTVTSVAASVPSFLSISGSPITTSGTLAISYSGTALPIANGGTGQTAKTASFDALAPNTTKGDITVFNGTNNVRLPVGANNYVLTADSTQATGLKWNILAYNIDYLVVAGGAGGGGIQVGSGISGGGGAGGYLSTTSNVSVGTSYSVVVGGGGAGGAATGQVGASGGTSSFNSTAPVGGGGGSAGRDTNLGGVSGGSGGGGGGGGGGSGQSAGSGTSGQGNSGGTGYTAPNYGSGGGGGAGGVGAAGTSGGGGNGGVGLNWQSLGTYYAGGGGGASYAGGGTQGTGGTGGGGNGSNTGAGGAATANTGGGGGGTGKDNTGAAGGNGGSGVVIIRYSGSQIGTGGTVTSAGGYTYHTFTSSGTFTA